MYSHDGVISQRDSASIGGGRGEDTPFPVRGRSDDFVGVPVSHYSNSNSKFCPRLLIGRQIGVYLCIITRSLSYFIFFLLDL